LTKDESIWYIIKWTKRRKQEEFMDKYLFEDVMVSAIIVVMAAFAIAVVLSIL